MEQVLVLSFANDGNEAGRAALTDRGRTIGDLLQSTLHHQVHRESFSDVSGGSEVVLGWGHDHTCDVTQPAAGRFAYILCRGPYTTDGIAVSGEWLLLSAADSDRFLQTIAPPFGAAFRKARADPVELVTDVCGLKHLYVRQAATWAAASTSSLLLALLAPIELDDESIHGFALAGNFDGIRTPFRGVEKIANGRRAKLINGRVSVDRPLCEVMQPPGGSDAELVREGASILQSLVEAAWSSHAEAATLELSGGFDSRGLLAALVPSLRKRTIMLTLGTPDSPDWEVARQLTDGTGLAHEFVDLRGISDLAPDEAWDRIVTSALRHDASGVAVATAVLGWVEERLPQAPRFNGINGEYARGRFYAGQRGGRLTPARVERLARWRVFANDAVDPWLFSPGVNETAREATIARLQVEFSAYGQDWLRATDDHFLYGRMQRWCGSEFSASCTDRPILAPYFCSPFLVWARRLSPDQKRSSRLFSAVIERLDPGLAAQPLVTAITPHQAARRAMSARIQLGTQFTRRVAKKARQRVLPGTDAPPAGAQVLGNLALRHLTANADILEPLTRIEWISPQALESIVDGSKTPSTASIGFLANLVALEGAQRETSVMT